MRQGRLPGFRGALPAAVLLVLAGTPVAVLAGTPVARAAPRAAAIPGEGTGIPAAYPAAGPGTHFLNDDALIAGFKEPGWYKANIPFLDVPDQQIQQAYYYRWRTWKEHIRATGPANGDILTEFFGAPGYSAPFGGIDAAAGHHIDEGRWVRDQQYVDSYLTYWLRGAGSGPKPATDFLNASTTDWAHEYSFWAASAAYADAEVTGDWSFAKSLEGALIRQYDGWKGQFNPQLGLYWQVPVWDATELTASSYETDPADPYHGGAGYRPTLNAYQYGDAEAIAAIAAKTGDQATARAFARRAAGLRSSMQKWLWDPARQFFYHMARDNNPNHQLVSSREEMGFVPWMFDMPQPSDSVAWQQITDTQGFAAPYGPTTVERRSRWFMYQASQGCCHWDGPSWPYETSQTLTGLANLLDVYPSQPYVTKADYDALLRDYALSQYQDGQSYLGQAHDPDNPVWMYSGDDYNHSSFNDLVISGLIGLRPQARGALQVKPLVPDSWRYFTLENVPYHGHNVTVLWDRDGSRYGQGPGLHLYVDGRQVTAAPALRPLTAELTAGLPAEPRPRPAGSTFPDDAVNVYGQGYPRAFASNTWRYDNPQNAIDGQNFYDDIPEDSRWTDYGSPNAADYIGVDFGTAIAVNDVRIYTYDDTDHGGGVHTPAAYSVQYWTGGTWADVPSQRRNPPQPAGNALNQVTFPTVTTSQVRVVFTRPGGAAVGVSELEAGSDVSTQARISLGAASAAALSLPGGRPTAVTTTVTNTSGHALTHVHVSLPVPAGWHASASTRTDAPEIGPRRSFRTTWELTPAAPADTAALFAYASFGPAGVQQSTHTRVTADVGFDPGSYVSTQIDDRFTTGSLSTYQVLQPPDSEVVPQFTVADGHAAATAGQPFFGILQSAVAPVSRGSAAVVDAGQFTNDPAEAEDTLFVGLAKDNANYVMAWYNNRGRSSGFDVRSAGQLNVGVSTNCCAAVTISPGDRFAIAYTGNTVSSYAEHGGTWQRLLSMDVGPAVNLDDPAVRAQYHFTFGLRGSHGTVAINRFEGLSAP
jgi:hypothetical protein